MAAYWIVRVNVLNAEKIKAYAPLAAAAVEALGGKYLARGGTYDTKEGAEYVRNVVVEWPSLEVAQGAYESPEYKLALDALDGGADRLFVIVEGL
jgi:uncharacterized protein (DUF1330 family)